MGDIRFIAHDQVAVKLENGGTLTLFWGDPVEVLGEDAGGRVRVRIPDREDTIGTTNKGLETRAASVFKLSMVDVQQGDGMVLESPAGKVVLIDGGDNQLFARYCAARFKGSSAQQPFEPEAIVITHGDADHFDGLRRIAESEEHENEAKRLFLHPKRIYHNGLVKGPGSLKVTEIFGRTIPMANDEAAIVTLVDDPRTLPEAALNRPFANWVKAVNHWQTRGPIQMRALQKGDDDAFDFLADEGIAVEVLGPLRINVRDGGQDVDALPLLHNMPKVVDEDQDDIDFAGRSFSASHTINGHSVTMRVVVGNVRMLLGGDLNTESMRNIRLATAPGGLESEVLKVPHHGSHEYDYATLEAVKPIVSLISSGDESTRKEHIHPRATLMGSLGKASRVDRPLVFCTELTAFFQVRGWSIDKKDNEEYFGFERTNFGIVHVRTDGERVLVFTHSGKKGMKEVYRFRVNDRHEIDFEKIDKH